MYKWSLIAFFCLDCVRVYIVSPPLINFCLHNIFGGAWVEKGYQEGISRSLGACARSLARSLTHLSQNNCAASVSAGGLMKQEGRG
jgi:hypothetical protein